MAPMAKDLGAVSPHLVTSREPTDEVKGSAKSVGDQAFNDAVVIIAIAWVVLFLLAFTLRRHNI